MNTRWTLLVALVACGVWAGGCYQSQHVADGDGDGDTDGDTDGDSDGDSDGDGDADYIVHEWGVFTEGAAHAGTMRWAEDMVDKPILYFYADEPLTVAVEVDLTGGRASETWPEIALGESIAWPTVRVGAEPCTSYDDFPGYGEGQCNTDYAYYCEATELPYYVVPEASCLETGGVESPLLFYAGEVAEAPLAMTGDYCELAVWTEGDPGYFTHVTANLTNQLDETVGPMFVIYRDLQGECYPWECWINRAEVAIQWVDEVRPGESITLELDTTVLTTDEDEPGYTVDIPEWLMDQEDVMEEVLVGEGLTSAEARALLAGWNHVFFDLMPDDALVSVPMGSSLAVVYPVSREAFDTTLPIRFDPPPRELVRAGLSLQFIESDCVTDSGSGDDWE